MRKKAIWIMLLVIGYLFLGGFAPASFRPMETGAYGDGNFYIRTSDPKGFKILFFADTQMMSDNLAKDGDTEKTLRLVDTLIAKHNPNLVAFMGDLTDKAWDKGRNQLRLLYALGETVEKHGVPWTYIWGNHDAESTDEAHPIYPGSEVTKREATQYMRKNFSHALVSEGDPNTEGVGNFYINIVDDNDVVAKSLYLFDTVRNDRSHCDGRYGGILSCTPFREMTLSQAEWYARACEQNALRNGGSMPEGILLAHVMTVSGYRAYGEGKVLYGERLEGKPPSGANGKAFAKLEEYMRRYNAVAYFAGHFHKNDFCARLGGITYTFVQHSSYCNYYKNPKSPGYRCTRGATLATLEGYFGLRVEQALIRDAVKDYDWDKGVVFPFDWLF